MGRGWKRADRYRASPLPDIKASADNPDIKATGGELGKAVFTVAKAINVVLLPIAALNYGYDRARIYFQNRFEPDLKEKLANVPADEIVEPKPSIAGPIMQGLAFSHDEDALRDMYLNLLASAMTKRAAKSAHPAFVEIIKQLTTEEAQALCSALSPPESKEIVQIRLNVTSPSGGWLVLLNHVMAVTDATTKQPIENPDLPAMVDNWIRLGLIDVSYTEFLQSDAHNVRYEWARNRPEFKRFEAGLGQQGIAAAASVVACPGRFRNTAFGNAFYRTVGLHKILEKMLSGIAAPNASA